MAPFLQYSHSATLKALVFVFVFFKWGTKLFLKLTFFAIVCRKCWLVNYVFWGKQASCWVKLPDTDTGTQ